MNFAHHRMLDGLSYPQGGMSIPALGMSLPYDTMSMPTSIPTSMPQNVATNPPTENAGGCVPPDLTNAPSSDIALVLEVETLSSGAAFVDGLTQGLVSAVASSMSLCLPSGTRMLVVRRSEEAKAIALQVSRETGLLLDGEWLPLVLQSVPNHALTLVCLRSRNLYTIQ